ncbi:PREDICTED: gamma-tubulin complex component 5 [Polistes canadensis]|uniref:gamma-tubulin complex component 5 n=1 Tax=Polistes canadensis TaxID=91411 RepID=UPI000718FD0D|nr:PREDICTED: gamma-tubulin complex component 5 [Polistes canadensis]
MGTKILKDIQSDIKLLITAITDFEEDEEGFQICERFVVSNIKHHQYLSVNSHAVKQSINNITTKLSIYAKFKEAKKFQELIDFFLNSFDFEHHPQYDLQWTLLALLFDLSSEIDKVDLNNLKSFQGDFHTNVTIANEKDAIEEIDWADYLKEGEEDFFCDFKDDESSDEWSDDTEKVTDLSCIPIETTLTTVDGITSEESIDVKHKSDILMQSLIEEFESRKWLMSNVQNTWWDKSVIYKYPVCSKYPDAHFCQIWHETVHKDFSDIILLNEYQACKEILWIFHVQTEMTIFERESEFAFRIRPNVSVPSLTTAAFQNMLSPLCEYLTMIQDIEVFDKELLNKDTSYLEYKKPPFVYEAYNAAIKEKLLSFRMEIISIEKDITKQASSQTLLSLLARLEKPLKRIKILHEVHKISVSDWKLSSNWNCASKLLSNLLLQITNSHCQEKTNLCINLYLSTIPVYLNIIDTWLGDGRLEDWRDEFIIERRISDEEVAKTKKQCVKFLARPLDDICLEDNVIQLLINKVQHIGHSIDLLVSLNRIMEMWNEKIKTEEKRISLKDEFYTLLLSEICKYTTQLKEPIDISPSEVDGIASISECDEDLEKNIMQQLSAVNNPFLMKAFKDYLPSALYEQDVVDSRKCISTNYSNKHRNKLFNRLQEVTEHTLPLTKILEKILSKILDLRYSSASKLVKNIMMQEYKLESHLKLMRSVYMMEAGHIMNKFYQILFHEIETNQMWNNSYFLSCILEEILSQQWPDSSSHWSIIVQDVSTHQVVQAADSITLCYATGWPINIVLNDEILTKYNEIFRFQLKLKWALWTLNNLKFIDLEGLKSLHAKNNIEHFQIRRLESLRFWLLHAIGSIHAYLSGQVLQSLGFMFDQSLTQADSLDGVISVHREYLDKVHKHCLLTKEFEDLMTTVNNLIEMCIHIRDHWDYKKLLRTVTELSLMESSYIKYHTYLALTLHNTVQYKDADYLVGLSSAFNCSMPSM